MTSVLQPWVNDLSMMQQTVVIELARGPDGLTKYHISKYLLRWFRRCFLYSALDSGEQCKPVILVTPDEKGGGSFTGPSYHFVDYTDGSSMCVAGTYMFSANRGDGWSFIMQQIVGEYIRGADELPHHWYRHFMHGVEIMGYKHPDEHIRQFWHQVYTRLCRDLHLNPETIEQLNSRLGDNRADWIRAGDEATLA